MKALIKDGALIMIVQSTDGHDLTGITVVEAPADCPQVTYKWNGSALVVDDAPFWYYLRLERDRRLTACDVTQLADYPLTDEQREAWRTYRQALRDLPENTTDPAAPDWPTPPAS